MTQLKAFIAGFLATLIFHQGFLAALHAAGIAPIAPYDLSPTAPLHVPKVVSLAFWGGIWAIVLWPMIRLNGGWRYWITAVVLGAIGPTLVALLIVLPMKGQAFAAGWDPKIWVGAFLLNGAWGFGVALFMRWLERPAATVAV